MLPSVPPIMNVRRPLSVQDRMALRSAVSAHPQWPSYRGHHDGWSVAKYTIPMIWDAADALGIDAEAAIREGAAAVNGSPVVDKLAAALNAGDDATACGAPEPAARVTQPPTTPVPVLPPIAAANDMGSQLAQLIAGIAGQSVSPEQVTDIVRRELETALAGVVPCSRIELRVNGDTLGTLEGHHHPAFTDLVRFSHARGNDGYLLNIWITGEAGSGKTTGARNLARLCGKEWHYNGALSDAFALLGFVDGHGRYHTTPFRLAYEGGHDYTFDEVDASDNSALIALNAALSNSVASFPDRQVQRHPDSRVIATANTWGHGGTASYVGTGKINAAFRDRFGLRLHWGYDEPFEIAIAGNPDFARRVQRARRRAAEHKIQVIISPRASIAGSALIALGYTSDEAAARTYLADLTPEQRRMVEGG